MKRLITMTGAVALAFGAAASTITVDSVIQRWPWNNKLDITYTVSGGQILSADGTADTYARIVFTANIGGTIYAIDGVHDVGASAADGTHTVSWTIPPGLKANGCTMTAQLYSAGNPSGDDYMVVNLGTGEISYEGILATQALSNTRYNTAAYKTEKLVLRKVPAGGAYPTGDDTNYPTKNSSTNRATRCDYYIGVFEVTQYQYEKVYGSNPSANTAEISGNVVAYRPVERASYNDLRASAAPTAPVPAVSSDTGSFIQRLNYKTGLYFDLPTEVMWEIACRAGNTTAYSWNDIGDQWAIDIFATAGGPTCESTTAVGSHNPNRWGLYDTAGNVWEFCLDDNSLANLADAADPFIPAWASNGSRMIRGGCYNLHGSTVCRASYRDHSENPASRSAVTGFRLAFIAK